jgi:hypothetical protein
VTNDDDAHRSQDNLAPVGATWERYLMLGLRLGRHVDGLVDAYFGPPELAERSEREPLVEPAELAAEAEALRGATDDGWLRAQLLGCETTARRLAGEPIGWAEEVERCYGAPPRRTDEAVFEEAHARLEAALPGDGELGERYRTYLDSQALPVERLPELMQRLADACRSRTVELFGLPDGDATELEVVRDEPWGAFNYYLGGRRSRVVVNADLPVLSFRLPEMVAHELYPGHHTEHVWKEALLVDGEGNLGEAIFLVGTPQSTISEGIASLAPEIVGANALAAEVYADAGIAYDAPTADAVHDAEETLSGAGINAALQLHVDGRPIDEVADYLQRWTLAPRERVEKRLEFITHPTWRAYISCYTSGYHLCKQWVAGDNERFRRLLTEQLSTHDLAA